MYVKHLFMGGKMTLKLPQGSTVFIMEHSDLEFVRKVLELVVQFDPETEDEVAVIWEQLNREEEVQ